MDLNFLFLSPDEGQMGQKAGRIIHSKELSSPELWQGASTSGTECRRKHMLLKQNANYQVTI